MYGEVNECQQVIARFIFDTSALQTDTLIADVVNMRSLKHERAALLDMFL